LLEWVSPIDFQEKAEYSTKNYDTTKRETTYILCEILEDYGLGRNL
jgi:hypothetical protein